MAANAVASWERRVVAHETSRPVVRNSQSHAPTGHSQAWPIRNIPSTKRLSRPLNETPPWGDKAACEPGPGWSSLAVCWRWQPGQHTLTSTLPAARDCRSRRRSWLRCRRRQASDSRRVGRVSRRGAQRATGFGSNARAARRRRAQPRRRAVAPRRRAAAGPDNSRPGGTRRAFARHRLARQEPRARSGLGCRRRRRSAAVRGRNSDHAGHSCGLRGAGAAAVGCDG